MSRRPRTIIGCWGIQSADGPVCHADGTPALYEKKDYAAADCTLADMKPVRVTVRYPRLRPTP